jgi:AcrR family transcriptional regulator
MVKIANQPKAPLRQPRSLATERRLIAAVLSLLNDGGLDACTAPALARRAGVAVGTIYARYADKDALIAAALVDMASLGGGAADEAFSGWAEAADDLEDFLRLVARAAVNAARDHRTLLIAMREFARKYPDEAWRKRFRTHQWRARELILQGAVQRFATTTPGGEASLRMALAAIYGAVEVTWIEPLSGLFPSPPEAEPFIAALVDMQLRFLS